MYSLKDIQEYVNTEFENLNFSKDPQKLYDPFNYVLSNGGKKIRPALTLLGCSLFDNDIKKALPAAIALEIFHNFTLLHDDIMDKAEIRRGKPSVHKKWNESVAILAGDAMLIKAYEYLLKLSKEQFYNVFEVFNQTALRVCEGQQYDMDFENRLDVSENEYLKMIQLKTSVLIAACLKIGAIIGNATTEEADALYDFGIYIGIGFQLKDDYLDTYGNVKTFGKKIGGDICENKKTYMLINALELANKKQKTELLSIISQKEFNSEEKIVRVTSIYNELGLPTKTQKAIEFYYEKSTSILKYLNINSEGKQELYAFAKKMIYREK